MATSPGHGEHRNTVKLEPTPAGVDNDGLETFDQEESVGDVLISTIGERCTVDEVRDRNCDTVKL